MAVIASYETPGFQQDSAARIGSALAGIGDSFRRRKEEREQKELEEIDRFFKAAAQAPDLAATWGQDIKRKYGDKYSGVAPMVDLLARRYEVADKIRQQQQGGQEAWLQQWNQLNQGFQQQGQQIQQMPDAFPPPVAGSSPFSVMPEMPNIEKMQAQEEYGKTDPRYFARKALEQLSPEQQFYGSQAIGMNKDFAMPAPMTVFDPYKNLPQEQQALHAGLQGLLSPEQLTASRGKLGLVQTPARQAFQKHETAEREARETHDTTEAEADRVWRDKDREIRDRQMRARMALQDSLSRAREARRVNNEKGLIDYRSEKEGGGVAISWKGLVEDSKSAARDYDADLKEAMKGPDGKALPTKEAIIAKKDFLNERGSRPRVLSDAVARRIANSLTADIKAGELDPEEAIEEAYDIAADSMVPRSGSASLTKTREALIRRRETRVIGDRQEEAADESQETAAEARAEMEAKKASGELPPDFDVDKAVEDYLWTLAEQEGLPPE